MPIILVKLTNLITLEYPRMYNKEQSLLNNRDSLRVALKAE